MWCVFVCGMEEKYIEQILNTDRNMHAFIVLSCNLLWPQLFFKRLESKEALEISVVPSELLTVWGLYSRNVLWHWSLSQSQPVAGKGGTFCPSIFFGSFLRRCYKRGCTGWCEFSAVLIFRSFSRLPFIAGTHWVLDSEPGSPRDKKPCLCPGRSQD